MGRTGVEGTVTKKEDLIAEIAENAEKKVVTYLFPLRPLRSLFRKEGSR
jgi:hypothetical protein